MKSKQHNDEWHKYKRAKQNVQALALSLLEDKLCEQRRASRDDDAGEQRGDRYDQ